MLKIVAGIHKGRHLSAPAGRDTRPTSSRTRESLFNILAHCDWVDLDGAVVIDAFAGSGALGLEALSRGADHATFLEKAPAALAALRDNAATLGETARCDIRRADATRPGPAPQPCTLALLDAPYHQSLSEPALTALARDGWLAPGAMAVVEIAADETLIPPPGFALRDQRRYGAALVMFLTWQGQETV